MMTVLATIESAAGYSAKLLADGTVDAAKADLVGRLGGDAYSTTRDRFDLPKPKPR